MNHGPETIKEARAYRYGVWAGYPTGSEYIAGYCVRELFPGGRGELHRQCMGRLVKETPFCAIHQPGAREKRAASRPPTRFEREMAELDRREAAYRDLRRLRKAIGKIAGMPCNCLEEMCGHAIAKKAIGSGGKR